MSGFWGIYQKCCKIYLWNNLPTGKVLPYQSHRACACMCSLIFTIRTLPVLIIHTHVRHCHWQWYLARPRLKTSSWVSWAREMVCAGWEGRAVVLIQQQAFWWRCSLSCALLRHCLGNAGEGCRHSFSSPRLCEQGWSQWAWKAGSNSQPKPSQI